MGYLAYYKRLLDTCQDAANHLLTIDPHEKGGDEKALKSAREHLRAAKNIYILGYGFDPNNNKRVALRESITTKQPGRRNVFFTNKDNHNRINKRASEVFIGNRSNFHSDRMFASLNDIFCEKSTCDVYGALARDFEFFSEG